MVKPKNCATCNQPIPRQRAKKSAAKGLAEPSSESAAAPARKRQATEYSLFVKQHYANYKDVPLKDRFKQIGAAWKDQRKSGLQGSSSATMTAATSDDR
jgi:hypothetical protein